MDCHFRLQGIFLTLILNPHLLHWQGNLLALIPPGTSSLCSPSKSWITRRQGAAPTSAWRAQYELQLPGNNGSALSATHYLGGFKGMIIFSFFPSLIFKEHIPPTRQTHYVFLKNEEPKITWSDQTKKTRISRTLFFSLKVKVKLLNRVQLFVTPWTVTYQVPPFMGFSRQEYWSGLPFPSKKQVQFFKGEKRKFGRFLLLIKKLF